MEIPEADWRVFKEIRAQALDRFCRRIVDECRSVCDDETASAHQSYLKLYELIHQRDKEIQNMFDDFRRSTAIGCLITMRQHGLVNEAELSRFSPKTILWVTRAD